MAFTKPSTKPAKPASPTVEAGYRLHRDADGLTPRQRVDARKADLLEIELAQKRGDLVSRADVEARDKADAEVLRSDLSALAPKLSSRLSGKVFSIVQVREIVMAELVVMVSHWQEAALVGKEAMPRTGK